MCAGHGWFNSSNLDILMEVLKAFGRAVDADEVVDEEHAGRLVAVVSFYFRRSHAPLEVPGHPSHDLPVVLFVIRVRAILVVAVDAHAPLSQVEVRAAVLHDGAVDLFLNCTSLLDDDNVVLAGVSWLRPLSTQRSIQRRSGSAFVMVYCKGLVPAHQ